MPPTEMPDVVETATADAAEQGEVESPEPVRASEAATVSEPRGISSAKQHVAMNKGASNQQASGSSGQVLPGDTASVDRENVPVAANPVSPELMRVSRHEPVAHAHVTGDSLQKSDDVSAPATSALISDPRVRSLERTQDMVALHSMRLRDLKTDSLQVVIKPGSGLQLSLDLRQRGDEIEVQALLQRGDFDHLNRHWSELQQRLESRGVRLANLTTSDQKEGNPSHSRQQQQSSGDTDPLVRSAVKEFGFAGSMTESVSRRSGQSKGHRGWESWA
jgi:hypothetical protein